MIRHSIPSISRICSAKVGRVKWIAVAVGNDFFIVLSSPHKLYNTTNDSRRHSLVEYAPVLNDGGSLPRPNAAETSYTLSLQACVGSRRDVGKAVMRRLRPKQERLPRSRPKTTNTDDVVAVVVSMAAKSNPFRMPYATRK